MTYNLYDLLLLLSIGQAAPAAELDPSKVKVNDFDLISVIGRGSYGKVLKVKHRSSNKVYAMKVLNKKVILDKNELEHTKNERSILVKLRSPFLVQLHFAFQTADRCAYCCVSCGVCRVANVVCRACRVPNG
jgi:serine/threonine protein kinase